MPPIPAHPPELSDRTPPGLDRAIDAVRALQERGDGPVCAYIYDLSGLRAHVGRLVDSLPEACQLYYAMKANSEAPILRCLAPIVHGFEVASLGEVAKARAADATIPVIFGGPGKTPAEIDGAIGAGVGLIHVESPTELHRVEQAAARRGRRVPILLRANLRLELPSADMHMAGSATQFGIEEAEVPGAIALARRCPHLELRGFHFHALSNNLDAEAHARLVAIFLDRARAWADASGLALSVVNAGGGVGVSYEASVPQFDWPGFVDRLGTVLDQQLPDGCSLVFECGRYLAAASGYYAAEVLDIKRTHGATFAVVRGGSHHFRLPAAWRHSHPFVIVPRDPWDEPYPRPEVSASPVTVAGQLCTPRDILARDVEVPRLRVGDALLFPYAGAYGWTISHHDFLSHPHPEQVYLD